MRDSLDIVFTHGGTWISKAIVWATWGKWSHVGVINDMGERITVIDTSFGKGAREQYINDFIDETAKHEIVCVPCTAEQKERIIKWMQSQVGTKYDVRLFLGFLFKSTRFDDPNRFVCSEFVASPMATFGLLNLGKHRARRINPTVLYWLCKTLATRQRL